MAESIAQLVTIVHQDQAYHLCANLAHIKIKQTKLNALSARLAIIAQLQVFQHQLHVLRLMGIITALQDQLHHKSALLELTRQVTSNRAFPALLVNGAGLMMLMTASNQLNATTCLAIFVDQALGHLNLWFKVLTIFKQARTSS